MKLYATITSERATKGQGGNDYLDIYINDDGGEIGYLRIIPDANNIRVRYVFKDKEDKTIYIPKNIVKAKRQKGECLADNCFNERMHPRNYCREHLKKQGFINE